MPSRQSERREESRSALWRIEAQDFRRWEQRAEQDSSLRPVESHVIPAKLVLRESGGAGIQLVATLTPACAGVTKRMTFISMGGPQAHDHSE